MDNKDFALQLKNRTLTFTIRIIHLPRKLPNTPEARVIRNQITRSGSSIGANYREANRSRSKADFVHKIRICESEASETQYWLKVIQEMKWLESKTIKSVDIECKELLALFTSISYKLKK